jgi:putative iron-regulated protein
MVRRGGRASFGLFDMQWFFIRVAAPFALATSLYSMPAVAAPEEPKPVPPTAVAVVNTYANIAYAMYGDAYDAAKRLRASVAAFLARPNVRTLGAARAAWKAARTPYMQTEGFRFGNPIVDEWEPRVNAWPLDEGLIDYVAPAYGTLSDKNPLFTANVIARTRIRVGARTIDTSRIDKALLRQLQAADGVESNVATGYHAIEFLLWGQDLRRTGGGAGERPHTDYDTAHCTHGNCARRAAFLKAAVDLLIDDLAEMEAAWGPGGKARAAVLAKKPEQGLAVILMGLGSLTYGELAGERMKLGLVLHDPEEEQDCFSDNTHNAHYFTQLGMTTLWRGTGRPRDYTRWKNAAFLRAYVMARAPEAARRLDAAMAAASNRIEAIQKTGNSGQAYDQLIAANNPAGNKMVQDAIDALIAQKRALDAVVAALGLDVKFENAGDFENAGRS